MIPGNALVFLSNSREVFQVPLSQVNNTTPGKNEVILEMAHDAKASGVELLDMRLFVPNTQSAGETEAADGDAVDEDGRERKQLTASEVLLESIREHLDGGKVMGEKIVAFESVSCVYPRCVARCLVGAASPLIRPRVRALAVAALPWSCTANLSISTARPLRTRSSMTRSRR